MTAADREAAEALRRRLEHAAAIAGLIAEATFHSVLDGEISAAFDGVAGMIRDASKQLKVLIGPEEAAA